MQKWSYNHLGMMVNEKACDGGIFFCGRYIFITIFITARLAARMLRGVGGTVADGDAFYQACPSSNLYRSLIAFLWFYMVLALHYRFYQTIVAIPW